MTIELLPTTSEAVLDLEPAHLEGEFLEQYRQMVIEYDRGFVGFPEHQRQVLRVLSRLVAEDYVSGLNPLHPRDLGSRSVRDRRMMAAFKEIGTYSRAADQVELQKTELAILFIGIVGEVVGEVIGSQRDRKKLMSEVRKAFLQLAGAGS